VIVIKSWIAPQSKQRSARDDGRRSNDAVTTLSKFFSKSSCWNNLVVKYIL